MINIKITLPNLIGLRGEKMKIKKTGGGYGGSSVKLPKKGTGGSGKVKMPRQKAPKVLKG
jgi:hypothetical protein